MAELFGIEIDPDKVVALFDWLPEEIAKTQAPVIVTKDKWPEIDALVDSIWDNDAIVGFCSRHDEEALISHFRSAVRFNSRGTCAAEGEATFAALAGMLSEVVRAVAAGSGDRDEPGLFGG